MESSLLEGKLYEIVLKDLNMLYFIQELVAFDVLKRKIFTEKRKKSVIDYYVINSIKVWKHTFFYCNWEGSLERTFPNLIFNGIRNYFDNIIRGVPTSILNVPLCSLVSRSSSTRVKVIFAFY